MKDMTFKFTETQLGRLRTLALDDLRSLTELLAYDKLEACYQKEYVEVRQLAERLGVKLGKLPKQLRASAKQAAEARGR